jgi:hypothetical protein
MAEAQVSILGGLPVIAQVTFTRGDGWTTDDDAEVYHLYWAKRDGTKGKEVSQKIYEKLEKRDPYWQVSVTEQVSDALAYEDWIGRNGENGITQLFLEPA